MDSEQSKAYDGTYVRQPNQSIGHAFEEPLVRKTFYFFYFLLFTFL